MYLFLGILASFFYANVAYADFNSFLTNVNKEIVNPIILLMFALATLFFLWGVFEFIANQGSEEKRTVGKNHMLWGVIGLAIMMGVFSIMHLILNTLNVKGINPEQGTVNIKYTQ